jgi:hypothetical protein
MPDPRELAGDEASRAEVEFNRVVGIASTRRDRGELSAGAYAVILDRARKSRDWGGVGPKTKGGQVPAHRAQKPLPEGIRTVDPPLRSGRRKIAPNEISVLRKT